MNRIIKAELYKLLHNKTVIFSFLLVMASSVIIYYLSTMFDETNMLTIVASTLSTIDILFIAVVASLICTDYEGGTMKNVILSGIPKAKIYLGRWIACIIISSIILLIGMIGSAIGAGILYGFSIPNSEIGLLLESVGLQFIMLFGIVSLTYFVSSIVKKNNFSLMLSLLILNFSQLIFIYLDNKFKLNIEGYSFASLMDSVSTLKINGQVLSHLCITIGSLILITMIIGTSIFKKSEI